MRHDALGVFFISLELSLDVVLKVVEARGGVRGEGPELDGERLHVLEVTDADAVARRLGRVRRADAALGGANLVPGEFGFAKAVNLLVEFEQHVRSVGDDEPGRVDLDPRLLEGIDLLEHAGEVDHHAVAHDALGLLVEDAGWHEVEGVLFALVVVDGVAGVGAALAPGDDVVLLLGLVTSGVREFTDHYCSRIAVLFAMFGAKGREGAMGGIAVKAPGFRFSGRDWRAIAHLGEDVDELPLALVSPLGAEDGADGAEGVPLGLMLLRGSLSLGGSLGDDAAGDAGAAGGGLPVQP